jgi:hypothetical protein
MIESGVRTICGRHQMDTKDLRVFYQAKTLQVLIWSLSDYVKLAGATWVGWIV